MVECCFETRWPRSTSMLCALRMSETRHRGHRSPERLRLDLGTRTALKVKTQTFRISGLAGDSVPWPHYYISVQHWSASEKADRP